SQSMKTLAPSAQEDRHAELQLELLDAARQRGLAHVASPRRAPKMSLLGDRHQILELPQEHRFQPCGLRSRAEWPGSHLGCMIIPILENVKTIDSINVATVR